MIDYLEKLRCGKCPSQCYPHLYESFLLFIKDNAIPHGLSPTRSLPSGCMIPCTCTSLYTHVQPFHILASQFHYLLIASIFSTPP